MRVSGFPHGFGCNPPLPPAVAIREGLDVGELRRAAVAALLINVSPREVALQAQLFARVAQGLR